MSDDQTNRSYRPGDWFGIFGTHVSVLLPSTEKSRVIGLWELVDGGADFDELLDALIATGLRSLPGFVLISEAAEPTRIVVRGPARATLTSGEGDVVVDGGQAATWVERSVNGVTAARIETGVDDAEGPDFSIRDGLVRVARIDSPAYAPVADEPVEADQPVTDEAAEAAEVMAPPVGAPVVVAGTDSLDGPTGGQETMPFQTIADDDAAQAEQVPFEEAPAGQSDADQPDPDQPDLDLPDSDQPWGDDPLGSGSPAAEESKPEEPALEEPIGESIGDELAGLETVEDTPADAEPAAQEGGFPWTANEGNVYAPPPAPENPFGAPGAPASDLPDQPGFDQVGSDGAGSDQAGFEQAGFDQAGSDQPAPEHSPWDRPIEDAPAPDAQSAVDLPAPDPGLAEDHDDHDGHTVAGGWDPNQFQRQHPGIPGQPPAPSVTAQPVARLVLSSGETVDVDRAILIGRAPEARRFTSTAQPRLVTVVSPHSEISSTHVEVRPGSGADHGSAVVTDMGSTNGTVLTLPGFGPEELQPGMAVQLIPGSIIDLGDGVTIQVTSV